MRNNQITHVRYPQIPSQRTKDSRRQRPKPTIEEDIYMVILDVYDKMKFLIAINAILTLLIIIVSLYALAVLG